MPQEKIIIKFKPSGDKELINAINTLNAATKKLTGSTVAVAKATKGSTAATRQAAVATSLLGTGTKRLAKNNSMLANSFATLRSKLLLISFGAMLIERAFVSLVKAYGRQEAANEKLAVGLTNVRNTTEGVTQRLIDYSSALQKVTAFGDEMITTGMVQFTTFGLNEQAIKSLTPQVLNVARAIQTTSGSMPDLNSLFIAFGKATTTGIGTLTRYGVVLTEVERAQLESMDANESAVKIAEILDRQYGGLAAAYAKTTSGMLEAAAAARGDAAEAFGEVLAPAVLFVSEGLKEMFEAMSPERINRFFAAVGIGAVAFGLLSGNIWKAVKALKAFQIAQIKTGWGAIAAGVGLASFALMEYFDVLGDVNDKQGDYEKRLKELTGAKHIFTAQVYAAIDAINAEKEAFSMLLPLDKKLLDAKEKEESLYQRLHHMKDGMSETEIQLLEIKRQENHALELFNLRLIDETEFKTRLYALDIKRIKLKNGEELIAQKKLNAALDKEKAIRLSVLESAIKYGIESKNAGKAAEAAARGVIEQWIVKAAAVQFEKIIEHIPVPPPFNVAIAAAGASALAATMSSMLSGIHMERGGLIGGRRHSQGGTMINAEQGEFIMSRSAVNSVGIENLNRMNEGGGGGSVTVNVSGNVLSQDFVEGELAENIKEAIRRGTDFGIS